LIPPQLIQIQRKWQMPIWQWEGMLSSIKPRVPLSRHVHRSFRQNSKMGFLVLSSYQLFWVGWKHDLQFAFLSAPLQWLIHPLVLSQSFDKEQQLI
jgi:hypothetical protein